MREALAGYCHSLLEHYQLHCFFYKGVHEVEGMGGVDMEKQ